VGVSRWAGGELGRWHSQNLAGVALPVNADIPAEIDVAFVDEVDNNAGPLGAKGIGELSATGVAAAVAKPSSTPSESGSENFRSRQRGLWKRRHDASLRWWPRRGRERSPQSAPATLADWTHRSVQRQPPVYYRASLGDSQRWKSQT
jgi:hypothetical protein